MNSNCPNQSKVSNWKLMSSQNWNGNIKIRFPGVEITLFTCNFWYRKNYASVRCIVSNFSLRIYGVQWIAYKFRKTSTANEDEWKMHNNRNACLMRVHGEAKNHFSSFFGKRIYGKYRKCIPSLSKCFVRWHKMVYTGRRKIFDKFQAPSFRLPLSSFYIV